MLAQLLAGAAEWPWAFEGKVGTATLKVNSQVAAVDFSTPGLTRFALDIPDSRDLEKITGPLPHVGKIHFEGELKREAVGMFSLPALKGNLGEAPLSAAIELDLTKRLPRITGDIELEFFDVDALTIEDGASDLQPEPKSEGEEPEVVAGAEPAPEAPGEEKFVLPLEGSFKLSVGEVRNAATTIRDLGLSLEVEETSASATVGVEFAGAELSGELGMEVGESGSIEMLIELTGKDAELDELIKVYSGNQALSGRFEHLHYEISGSGPSAMHAWARRSVELSVENAALTYRGRSLPLQNRSQGSPGARQNRSRTASASSHDKEKAFSRFGWD